MDDEPATGLKDRAEDSVLIVGSGDLTAALPTVGVGDVCGGDEGPDIDTGGLRPDARDLLPVLIEAECPVEAADVGVLAERPRVGVVLALRSGPAGIGGIVA